MIEKLATHYSFTHPASIYDEEALTALELAGRQGAKINEVINDQNALRSETENHMIEQDKKLKEQTDSIIPDTIDEEIRKNISGGTFDKAIDKYAGNLEERVDNLLGSLEEGSTTSDGELIDLRVGADGVTYESAGKAVRSNMNRFYNMDIVTSRFTNKLKKSHIEQIGGGSAYEQFASETFTLNSGEHCLYINDSNAIGLYVYRKDTMKPIYQVQNTNIVGKHVFMVEPALNGKEFCLYFNMSYNNPSINGAYFADCYLYEMKNSERIIPNELIDKTNVPLLETDMVLMNHKNLYPHDKGLVYKDYDGATTYTGVMGAGFKLNAGRYFIIVPKSNFVGFYIMQTDDTQNRILSVTGNCEGVHYFNVNEEQAEKTWALYGNCALASANPSGDYYCEKPYIFEDNGKPLFPDFLTGKSSVKKGYLEKKVETMGSGDQLLIENTVNVRKNKSMQFSCDVTTFGGVRVGHGKSSYGGNYVEITTNAVNVYSYTTGANLVKTETHGLNITDFLRVNIHAKEGKADIEILTLSGSYAMTDVTWNGSNGYVFAESISSTLTNVSIKWKSSDIHKKVWVFGDSYQGATSPTQCTYHLLRMGYKNFLLSGYAGANASAELESLKTLLAMGTPDVIVWCLGMNNGDNGTVNSQWVTCLNEVSALCTERGIEIVVATIPTVPTVDNNYKNNYVRSYFSRVLDLDKAVVKNGSWYNGMLSSDNVHPTEAGAKALAMRMLEDVPELMM